MLGGSLFKPKWQHKNPRVRRDAVLALDAGSEAAQQAFVQLAQHDPDLDIRLLALKRIDSVVEIIKFVKQPEEALAATACQSLAKFCQQDLDKPALDAVLDLLDGSDDEEFVQQLAAHAHNVALRQKALEKINKPSLLAEMVLGDSDLNIRLAALKRIDKVSTLQRIVKQSRRKDKSVFNQAQQQLQTLQQHQQLPEQLRQQSIALQSDLAAVIKMCQEKQQWQASEAQVKALQQEWETIKQRYRELGQTETVFEGQAKLDQQFDFFSAQLQQCLAQQQQQQAAYEKDVETLNQFRALLDIADTINQQCQQLSPQLQSDDEPQIPWRDCRQRWQALNVPQSELGQAEYAALQLRFGDLGQAIEVMLSGIKQVRQWSNKARDIGDKIQRLLDDERLPSASDLRKLQNQWEKHAERIAVAHVDMAAALRQQINHKISKLQQRVDEARQLRKQNSRHFSEALAELKKALDEGKAKHAINMLRRCEKLLPQSDLAPRDPLQHEFQRVRAEARELQDWRNWSNSPVKENICADVEAILQDLSDGEQQAATISFSKIQQQIRDYRQEWNGLTHTESHSDKSLWKRFDEACKEVETICAGFFEQRDEQRKENLSQRRQYCQKLAQYAEHLGAQNLEDIDIKALDTVVRTAQSEWRQLGAVDQSEKERINQDFKSALSQLRAIQSAFRGENREAKQALITRLEKLNAELDEDSSGLREAIETTKQVQTQWKKLGAASKEKELWQTFQSLGNKIFARLNEQREEERLSREKDAAELDAIISQLEQAQSQSSTLDLQQVNQLIQRTREQWQAQENRKNFKGQQKRFERALANIESLRKTLVAQSEIDKRRQWIDTFSHLSELEASQRDNKSEDSSLSLDDMQSQFQRLAPEVEGFIEQLKMNDSANQENDDSGLLDKRRQLCISMEVLAGVPSPESDKEARMQYQVSLLAEKMKQGAAADDWQQVTQNMRQWWQHGLSRQDSTSLVQRFIKAAQSLLEK